MTRTKPVDFVVEPTSPSIVFISSKQVATMIRTAVFFAILVVAASAFVTPANRAAGESNEWP